MAPPTLLIASDGKQIFGDHTPTHVAFKARLSFIGGSPHGQIRVRKAHDFLGVPNVLLKRELTRPPSKMAVSC
jgi:hypothetical protein